MFLNVCVWGGGALNNNSFEWTMTITMDKLYTSINDESAILATVRAIIMLY